MVVCRINFENNPYKVYYSGQLIRGTVHLTLHERTKVRGVYIKFKGYAHTEWFEYVTRQQGVGENRKTVTVREVYQSNENYLYTKSFFVGGNDGKIYLEAGDYVHNFEVQLPLELPSSFEGDYGHIRYCASVVVVIPWGFDDQFKKPFTVIRALDLNRYPSLRSPISDQTTFTSYPCFLLCCSPSDRLRITAQIPVGGYAPGQVINLTLEADNKSNERVPYFKMELIKNVRYYARGKTRTQTFCRTGEESSRGVEVNQKRIVRMNLRIPPNPPTDETSCGIIKITYYIYLTADMGSCCSDPKIYLPITIGTTPLLDFSGASDRSRSPGSYPATSIPAASIPTAPVITAQPGFQPSAPPMDQQDNGENSQDSAPPYPHDDQDLPTYEESTDSKRPTENDDFTPRYPFYNRQTSYSKQ